MSDLVEFLRLQNRATSFDDILALPDPDPLPVVALRYNEMQGSSDRIVPKATFSELFLPDFSIRNPAFIELSPMSMAVLAKECDAGLDLEARLYSLRTHRTTVLAEEEPSHWHMDYSGNERRDELKSGQSNHWIISNACTTAVSHLGSVIDLKPEVVTAEEFIYGLSWSLSRSSSLRETTRGFLGENLRSRGVFGVDKIFAEFDAAAAPLKGLWKQTQPSEAKCVHFFTPHAYTCRETSERGIHSESLERCFVGITSEPARLHS